MTKEEYIAKHGEEAYKEHLEIVKERYKLKREEILSKNKERYKTDIEYKEKIKNISKKFCNKKYKNDPEFRMYNAKKQKDNGSLIRLVEKEKAEYGELYTFRQTYYTSGITANIDNWEDYIKENLSKEATEIDFNADLLNEDFLYNQFVENKEHNLVYGNIQILKYFVPLMCMKVHNNISFDNHNIEMIKYFYTFENNIGKCPINYRFRMIYLPYEDRNNKDKLLKYMLLCNLSADFRMHCSKYPTDKKLY
jgi:hypothetical protein